MEEVVVMGKQTMRQQHDLPHLRCGLSVVVSEPNVTGAQKGWQLKY